MKYIIETNMTDDTFGAFIPGLECRNVGIDEMKDYYYWPGDVRYMFMTLADHVLPESMVFNYGVHHITATLTCGSGDHWLRFTRISDAEAKTSGKREFNHMKWIDQLRADKKANKNYRSYNK